MKVLKVLENLFKKENLCVIPSLNFSTAKIRRGESEKETVKNTVVEDFANAYLSRVKRVLSRENISSRKSELLPRRNLRYTIEPKRADELDEMIFEISKLESINLFKR